MFRSTHRKDLSLRRFSAQEYEDMNVSSNGLRASYRVFISFTSSDKALAEYIADGLRRNLGDYNAVYCFTQPGLHGPKAGSRPSDNFIELIDKSLQKCNVFILLWSNAARRSNGVKSELGQARLLSMHSVKRMGNDFKIIPISINRCSLPFGLKSIVHINYVSGADMQATLNEILKGLELPMEHASPQEIFWRKTQFEIQTDFSNEDWTTFIQKYRQLASTYPPAISASMHYRYAIALLKTEKVSLAITAAQEGLSLENKEEDSPLLEQFTNYLKEKWQWHSILTIANLARTKFPMDARWTQLQWEASNNINEPRFFF